MAGKWEVEGGDNEDNQTHGPLIDMIEVEFAIPKSVTTGQV